MELDSLLNSQRWIILEILANEPSSPLELSKKIDTSVAYVSQQLKLLEAAGIVKKTKTGKSEKGKPRNLYEISSEFLHVTLLIRGNPKKKTIKINARQKAIMNIWLCDHPDLHRDLEKAFWEIEGELGDISGIFLDEKKTKISLCILSDSKKVKSIVLGIDKKNNSLFDVKLVEEKFNFFGLYPIHDPLNLVSGKEMKGGSL